MADEVYRVEIPIDVVDKTEPELTQIRSKVSAFETKMAAMQRRLGNFASGAHRIGSAMTRYVTLPIVAAGAASVKFYMSFQSSMTKIRSLVGASRSQVAKWSREILELAKRLPIAPQDLAEGLYFVASSGFKGAQAMKVLRASARAAAAGLGETKIVADAVTSAVSAYGPEVLKAKEATDVLLSTVKLGKGEPAELASSIGRVIAPAEAMGVSFREVGAALAAYSLVLPNVSENVTGLRGALVTFQKPTLDTKEALHEVGLTVDEVNEAFSKDFWGTLVMLRREMDAHNIRYAEMFGNIRALNFFQAVTGRRIEENTHIFDEMNHKLVDTNDALRTTMKEDPVARFHRAWSRVQATLIEIGPKILPVVEKVAMAFADVAESIGNMPPDKMELLLKVLLAAAVAGPVIRLAGGVASLTKAGIGAARWGYGLFSGAGAATAGGGGAAGGGVVSTVSAAAPSAALGAGGTAAGLALPLGLIGAAIFDGFDERRRQSIRQNVVEHGVDSRAGREGLGALGLSQKELQLRTEEIRRLRQARKERTLSSDEERELNGLLRSRREILRKIDQIEKESAAHGTRGIERQLGMLKSVNGHLTEEEQDRLRLLTIQGKYAKAIDLVAAAVGRATDKYVDHNKKQWEIIDGFQTWTRNQKQVESSFHSLRNVGDASLRALIRAYGDAEGAAKALLIANQSVNWGWESGGTSPPGGGGGGGGNRGRGKHGGKRDNGGRLTLHGPGRFAFDVGNITEDVEFRPRGKGRRGGDGGSPIIVNVHRGAIQAGIVDRKVAKDFADLVAGEIADGLDDIWSNTP